MASDPSFPIRDVSLKTGVNSVTLRAWERRYGLIKPVRTEKGHRVYSEQDISDIKKILSWLDKGVSIGKVKPLLNNEDNHNVGSEWDRLSNDLLETSQSLNFSSLESQLKNLSTLYPSELFVSKLVKPWLNSLSQLDRIDQPIIEQSSRQLLHQQLIRWTSVKSNIHSGIIQCGETTNLDVEFLRYELQDINCQSYDLGHLDPLQLSLSKDRLSFNFYFAFLGTGLNASWFQKNKSYWPENTFFVGEVGKIYLQSRWLDRPYLKTTKALLNHETYSGLVQK